MPPYPLAVTRTTTRHLRDLECVIVDDKRIALFRYAIRAARRLVSAAKTDSALGDDSFSTAQKFRIVIHDDGRVFSLRPIDDKSDVSV